MQIKQTNKEINEKKKPRNYFFESNSGSPKFQHRPDQTKHQQYVVYSFDGWQKRE